MHRVYPGSSQTGSPSYEGKVKQDSFPNKKLSPTGNHLSGKISFSNEVSLGILTILNR